MKKTCFLEDSDSSIASSDNTLYYANNCYTWYRAAPTIGRMYTAKSKGGKTTTLTLD